MEAWSLFARPPSRHRYPRDAAFLSDPEIV